MEFEASTMEDYEYDFNAPSEFDWAELLPTSVIYIITLAVGVCGNSLIVLATYRYRKMQSVTNILLASLASADLLLLTLCIPVKLAKLFSFTWTMGLFLCKWVYYMQNVSAICSVLTLTAICIERYYAILHPMRARYICTISQAKKVIAVTWILAIILAVPIGFLQKQMTVGKRIKAYWCYKNWEVPTYWRAHELYMLMLILVIPTCIMTYAYATICWEMWKVLERRSVMTSSQALSRNYVVQVEGAETIQLKNGSQKKSSEKNCRDDLKTVRQVIRMLVAVVVLFAICWTPLLIYNLLTAFGKVPIAKEGKFKYMLTAFELMAYFNSCINPIIYGFMSKNYRDSFQSTLCCFSKKLKGQKNLMNYSTRNISRSGSQTRNTSIR